MTIPTDLRTVIPALVDVDGAQQLFIDGSPFLVLGGELHNSSSSTPAAIRSSFKSIADLNMNTVLAAVTWEQFEPQEGEYDFTVIDSLLDAARGAGTRLIPLWFGAWKNGQSSYVPTWVKTDSARFERANLTAGVPSEHLSPFGSEARIADAKAFAAFMSYLRDADELHRTVIMVQVENEVGLLGAARDLSTTAREHFESDVPPAVFDALDGDPTLRVASLWTERGRPRAGTWSEVFGESESCDEAFMAYAYACHIGAVAEAGKREYPIPMFTNTWLDSEIAFAGLALAGGQRPGTYPSGGPLPHVAGIWRHFAPALDLIVPDIYFGDFAEICRTYQRAAGGLLIPEMRRDEQGAADAFVAIGSHRAIGVSPFGVDSFEGHEAQALRDAYALLGTVAPATFGNETAGIHLHDDKPEVKLHFGECVITARRQSGYGAESSVARGYGVIIRTGEKEFLAAGRGLILRVTNSTGRFTGILRAEELEVGALEGPANRVLNGDETHSGAAILLPALAPVPTNGFPIPASRPGTGLVRWQLYDL